LQRRWNALHPGSLPLSVNGKYDLETEQAVRVLQKEKGLTVDGETDPDTWKAFG
jgi:peptidoglycan hydrolase-like protein with peptidoglycan-binding domain